MNHAPLVSIILPVYNGEKFLAGAIQSCLDQTYTNFELIIVNDASTDRSLEIARGFQNSDQRIRILTNKKNLKLPASLNKGHRIAEGEYFSWTSHDNILNVDFLEHLVDGIYEKQCDVIYSNFDIIWGDGSYKRTQESGPVEELIFGDVIGASFLYSRKVYEDLYGYDRELFLVEDYDFFLRATTDFKICHLPESLYKYRIHTDSLTSKIQMEEMHSKVHREALKKMYNRFGKKLGWNKVTNDLLARLYFQEANSLKIYLKTRNVVKKDLQKFEHLINPQGKLGIIEVLHHKIFWCWFNNEENHSLSIFLKVLLTERSILFNSRTNKNSVVRLVLNCLPFGKR